MSLCVGLWQLLSSVWALVVDLLESINSFGVASSNYGSLIATLTAAALLFLIKEFSNSASQYSGVFFTVSTVESTDYNPYRNMKTFHTLVLFSDGYSVRGTSEKTGDVSVDRPCEYQGSGKIRGVITGRVERNYIRGSVLHIHMVEQGEKRETTTYMSIRYSAFFLRRLPLRGNFYTTASNAKGSVQCGREKFKEHPSAFLPSQST